MLGVTILAVLLGAAEPQQSRATDDCLFDDAENVPSRDVTREDLAYFQPSTWTCEGDRKFYGGWYGRHLRAMEEPSFAANDAAKGFSRRYRLLVLPSFTPAYSIRVDYPAESAANASGDLTAVTETGAGGYDPGAKVPLWSFAINERAAQQLDEAVKEAKTAKQPWRFKHPVKDGEIVICADGTTYVFESLDGKGNQQIVSRHQCDLNADQSMADILFQMHRLGRLTIPYEIMQIIVSR